MDLFGLIEIGAAVATTLFVVQTLLTRRAQAWRAIAWVLLFGGFSLLWTYGCIVLFYLIGAIEPDALAVALGMIPPVLWIVGLWVVQRRLLR